MRELFITLATLHRFDVQMIQFMFGQSLLTLELIPAYVTIKRSFLRVVQRMSFQIAPMSKLFPTNQTVVRQFVLFVQHHVFIQILLERKLCLTDVTFKFFLLGMDGAVLAQVGEIHEFLAALTTCVGQIPRVLLPVSGQRALAFITLTAFITLKFTGRFCEISIRLQIVVEVYLQIFQTEWYTFVKELYIFFADFLYLVFTVLYLVFTVLLYFVFAVLLYLVFAVFLYLVFAVLLYLDFAVFLYFVFAVLQYLDFAVQLCFKTDL